VKAYYDPEMPHAGVIEDVWGIAHALPTRTDDIAGMLQVLGIKGRVGDALACPLANYFRLFSQGERVAVDSNCMIEVGEQWFEAPDVVGVFMFMFDEGLYPELVDRLAIEARP
jgi:hypothetical protein